MPGHWRGGHQIHRPGRSNTQDDPSDPSLIPASQPQPPLPPSSTIERPAECINKYPTPAFALLCTMMDRLRSEEPSKRRDTLTRFMNLWRIKVGNDLYPLIRLLLPDVSFLRDPAYGPAGPGETSLQPQRSHVGQVLH